MVGFNERHKEAPLFMENYISRYLVLSDIGSIWIEYAS
jgi:hypothetical protein